MNGGEQREVWGSRIGLILAAAGNAIGIGNLLRFPSQAAQNGGGAFMVPYVISLLLFGLPMMWVAWTIGRYGGRFGHGTTPGMFDRMWSAPIAKYLGVLGVAIPLIFCIYYTYIESWCLAYSYFSLTGDYVTTAERHVDLQYYFNEFLGNWPTHSYFPGYSTALIFLLITLALNILILYRGIAKGIEILAKVAVPLLFVFCLILAVRVFTITGERGTAFQGLAFLWTPDFEALLKPKVWMAAAGQIFFTLSIGIGSLECYASYLRDNDDIALTGLTTAATNEFVEIIFGSLIAIPAAAVFFGGDAAAIQSVAEGGPFDIGMISMPQVLRELPGIQIFGTIWFLLLFLAAFTSSVAVCQPVMAFLEDEAKLKRGSAAMLVGVVWLLGTLPILYFYKYGALGEMDFWAGTIGLVVFSTIEVVIFAWIFKISRGWEELHRGADIQVPRLFYHLTRYVTPICLLVICGWWFWDAIDKDTLVPKPKVNYGVVDRPKYPGEFGPFNNKGETDQQKDARNEELEEIQKEIFTAIESVSRDLSAWAEMRISPEGDLEILNFEADPALREVLDRGTLVRWLTLKGFGYRKKGDDGTLRPTGAEVTLSIEALHTAPYVWLTRILIASFTLVFLVNVRVIWKERAESRNAPG